jgi:hypothetical protein
MPDKTPPSEPDPEGWSRFERAVDAAMHTPRKPKPKAKPDPTPPIKAGSR